MLTRQIILASIVEFCLPRKITPTTDTILRDHGFDSLDLIDLSMHLEDRYGISLQDETTSKWKTVGAIIDMVMAALPAHEVATEDELPYAEVAEGATFIFPDASQIIASDRDTSIRFPHSNVNAAIHDILTEFHAATANFPQWPTDPLHALAIVQEEVGEVQKEVLQLTYEPHKSDREKVKKEAIQMAAMSLRFLLSLDVYEYVAGDQHIQNQ